MHLSILHADAKDVFFWGLFYVCINTHSYACVRTRARAHTHTHTRTHTLCLSFSHARTHTHSHTRAHAQRWVGKRSRGEWDARVENKNTHNTLMQLGRKQSEENKNTPLDLFPIQGEWVARVERKQRAQTKSANKARSAKTHMTHKSIWINKRSVNPKCTYIYVYIYIYICICTSNQSSKPIYSATVRGGGLGSRPQKMYGERLGDGVEYHLMKPTPRR